MAHKYSPRVWPTMVEAVKFMSLGPTSADKRHHNEVQYRQCKYRPRYGPQVQVVKYMSLAPPCANKSIAMKYGCG